jgi:hypothetical protein
LTVVIAYYSLASILLVTIEAFFWPNHHPSSYRDLETVAQCMPEQYGNWVKR